MAASARLDVQIGDRRVGTLERRRGLYVFEYARGVTPADALSLTMPIEVEEFVDEALHPIFAMNLPEGYVLDRLRALYAKSTPTDPMLLLARTSVGEPIGRVRVVEEGRERRDAEGESLSDILAYHGAGAVFAMLEERYLQGSAVSGVQPKLLVPEKAGATGKFSPGSHLSLIVGEFIVKAGGSEYPGLAINEFVCMSIAKEAGIPVPEFYLSEDRQLFVMRRFDRAGDGTALGFEDFNTLMGRSSADRDSKYKGSYGAAAEVIEVFASPEHVAPALRQLFDTVALSCIVGNGDAHLKNFGLIYTHPEAGDVRMSEAYDITNTTAYLPNDNLALDLAGNRGFFAGRLGLLELGKRCGVKEPMGRVHEIIRAAEATLYMMDELLDQVPLVKAALRQQVESFSLKR